MLFGTHMIGIAYGPAPTIPGVYILTSVTLVSTSLGVTSEIDWSNMMVADVTKFLMILLKFLS